MSYIKQTWVDRAVEFFRRFSVTEDSAGNLTLTEEPGIVTSAGTPLDATRLNHIENGIEEVSNNLNLVQLNKANKIQEDWIAPVLQNGWVNNDPISKTTVGYYKDELGTVRIKGIIKNGTPNTKLFTLPSGYRPGKWSEFVSVNDSVFGRTIIDDQGNLFIFCSNNTSFSLDGISFRADG